MKGGFKPQGVSVLMIQVISPEMCVFLLTIYIQNLGGNACPRTGLLISNGKSSVGNDRDSRDNRDECQGCAQGKKKKTASHRMHAAPASHWVDVPTSKVIGSRVQKMLYLNSPHAY